VNDLCRKVDGAYCRPGMRGCVIAGKVTFQDGVIPHPVWPTGTNARDRERAATGRGGDER
jgi:hypothetical protein